MNDAVSSALEHLRLEGALFFRSELTEPFEFESSPLALADALVPGADRLTLFHIVASGSCWVAVDDGVRYRADAGDVIVLPYGDHYVMGGEGTAVSVSILSLLDPLPWAVMPVLRHGGGGRRTEIVCGYLHSTDPLFDPAMRALPPVFVVRLAAGPAAGWVKASIDYAMADAVPPSNRSPNVIATRLPELVLIEVLRSCLVPDLMETIKPTGSKIECQHHGSSPTSCGNVRSGWCVTRAPSRARAARRRAGGWANSWASAPRPCAAG